MVDHILIGNGMLKKILLVEDEALIALNQARILKPHGFEVVSVYNGENAVETIRKDPEISLVLMDIDLGAGIDGTEAARRILKIREVPLIFLTGHAEKDYVDRIRKVTRYGYVLKNSGEFVLRQSIQMAYELFDAKTKARQHLEESLQANLELEGREARLQHVNRVLLSLRGINHVITRETDRTSILDRSCRVMIENSGYHRVWIVMVEEGRPVAPYYHAGFNGKFSDMTSYLETGALPACARTAMEERRLVVIETHGSECLKCPFSEEDPLIGTELEDTVVMTIPLGHGDESYGWISVILPEVYGRNSDEHRLFEEIGEDISYALYGLKVMKAKESSDRSLGESEEKYRALYNNAPLPYQSLDPEGKFLDVNPSWLNTLGYRREEVIGKKYADFLHPDWKAHFEKNFPAFKKRGYVHDVQFMIRHKSGEYRYITFEGCIGYQPDGSVRQTYCVFKDITEQKKAEESLKESEQRLQTILDLLPIPILLSSGEYEQVEKVNRKFIELVGYTRSDIPDVSHWWLKAYPDEDYRREVSSEWQDNIMKARRENRDLDPSPVLVTCKDGSERSIVVRGFSLGELNIVVFLDFTDQKNTQKQLEESLAEKDYLLQELNHRVKNNLMMIASLLSLKESAMGGSTDLSDVRHQIEAIRIIHEKLFQSGDITKIDVQSYLRDLLELIFSNFAGKRVQLKIDIDKIFLNTKSAIPLGLVVNEIATNAVKYGFNGPGEPVFSLDLKRTSTGELEMNLSNTGAPFPENIRLDNPDTLGMQLITTLVKQLNGSLYLKRSPQPEFTIQLSV